MIYRAAVISEQGYRSEMEDAHFLDTNFGGKGWLYGGIYDGHGGKYAAESAAARLHRYFLEKLSGGETPGQAFALSYSRVSNEISDQTSGTTAVDFFIRDGEITVANAGDARAIIISSESFKQLSSDHRLDNPGERARVEGRGAQVRYPYIYRDGLGLMPTRTIGDEYFKPVGVIAKPSIAAHRTGPEDLMLLAGCDGLWDFMRNEEVAAFARGQTDPEKLVNILKDEVFLSRQGTDNLTIIAVSFGD